MAHQGDAATALAEPAAAGAPRDVKILKSVCRSCHGGCGVNLHVEDGRLVKVEGDRTSPLNRGRLCPIGTSTLDLVYHPDRLKYPMRRTGARGEGKWERISWDEALDIVAEEIKRVKKEHGPGAIMNGSGSQTCGAMRWTVVFSMPASLTSPTRPCAR